MIAALNIEYGDKGKGLFRIINVIKRNKITVELRKGRGICLMYVTYTSFNGKVNLDKLSGVFGSQSRRILCDNRIKFPGNSGFVRFESNLFKIRLCTNMVYQILKASLDLNISLGIYDPRGIISDFLPLSLEYCRKVTVVTNESKIYQTQLNRALDELGATAVITSKADELENCNLIVAPDVIDASLCLNSTSIVLTTQKPTKPTSGQIYYKYKFKMPSSLAQIKPDVLSNEYFCSALYTLENQYELGSIVPDLCSDGINSQTIPSIRKFLSEHQ